jgi:hypothetical protein
MLTKVMERLLSPRALVTAGVGFAVVLLAPLIFIVGEAIVHDTEAIPNPAFARDHALGIVEMEETATEGWRYENPPELFFFPQVDGSWLVAFQWFLVGPDDGSGPPALAIVVPAGVRDVTTYSIENTFVVEGMQIPGCPTELEGQLVGPRVTSKGDHKLIELDTLCRITVGEGTGAFTAVQVGYQFTLPSTNMNTSGLGRASFQLDYLPHLAGLVGAFDMGIGSVDYFPPSDTGAAATTPSNDQIVRVSLLCCQDGRDARLSDLTPSSDARDGEWVSWDTDPHASLSIAGQIDVGWIATARYWITGRWWFAAIAIVLGTWFTLFVQVVRSEPTPAGSPARHSRRS